MVQIIVRADSRKSDCVTLGKLPDEKTLQILSLHCVPTLQYTGYILYLVYILYPVCSLHFILTGICGTNTVYFWLQLFAQHTQFTTKYLRES